MSLSEEENDAPFEDRPPRDRILFLLNFIQGCKEMFKVQGGECPPDALQQMWHGMSEIIMNAIREEPALARASFRLRRSYRDLPLMHCMPPWITSDSGAVYLRYRGRRVSDA